MAKKIPFKVVILLLIIVAVALGGAGVYLYIISNRDKSSTDTPTLKLGCPVPDEYCEKYEKVYENDILFGFGYKLPRGTQIYTAAGGTLNFGKINRIIDGKSKFMYNSVRIINPLGYHIDYYFLGDTATPGTYNAPTGAYIGQAGAEIAQFGDYNVVIQISKPDSPEPVLIYPSK